jgi:ribosomal protein L37AE/L43A
MAATTDSKIVFATKKQLGTRHRCSICGKKLTFDRTSENLLACWKCMIVDVDS